MPASELIKIASWEPLHYVLKADALGLAVHVLAIAPTPEEATRSGFAMHQPHNHGVVENLRADEGRPASDLCAVTAIVLQLYLQGRLASNAFRENTFVDYAL